MSLDSFKTTFLAATLSALRKRATVARMAYTDVSQAFRAAATGETMRFNYVTRPTVNRSVQASNTFSPRTAPTSTMREMKLDQFWSVTYHVDDADAHTLTPQTARTIGATYGAALGDEIEEWLIETLGAYTDNATSSGSNKRPFEDNTDRIPDILQALVERDAAQGNFVMLHTPQSMSDLLKQRDFVAADERGQAGADTNRTGDLGVRLGFRHIVSNNIAKRTSDGKGAANGALAQGSTTIPVDGFGSNGVARGERLAFGTGASKVGYGVVSGYTGASGSVTLNRPLVAAASDNDVIRSEIVHGYAFDPNALVFGMRPTSTGGNAGADITPLVDPETGFALTMEVNRVQARTLYTMSAVFGAQVIRPEEIQRITQEVA